MVQPPANLELESLALCVSPDIRLHVTPAQFEALAAVNHEWQLERTAPGELLVNPPTGWERGKCNSSIIGELYLWWRQAGDSGAVFGASTGFTLLNAAIRAPDAAWVSPARWEALTPEQKGTFASICPDFVVELRSPSDRLPPLQAKLQEYLDNSARLGWSIDPAARRVESYRPGMAIAARANPAALSGETVLPGFALDLSRIWG